MKDAPSTASCCRIKGDDQGVEVTVRTSKVRLESSLRRSNKATLLQHQQGYLWISHSSKERRTAPKNRLVIVGKGLAPSAA
ncbi:hypothetical protein TNCT_10551 [Trichonephila clavata]|uniref:Uncharacterized protein n=1 Tax=Trichonephila clavata TaxID=2740835 RepID=A0A8X6LQT1_TRICU|nr:hypothetical protein TNCT_10551 [Trichonephila clavata]